MMAAKKALKKKVIKKKVVKKVVKKVAKKTGGPAASFDLSSLIQDPFSAYAQSQKGKDNILAKGTTRKVVQKGWNTDNYQSWGPIGGAIEAVQMLAALPSKGKK